MTAADTHQDHDWSLESLNKAYQQGYMAGLTGSQSNQPTLPDVLAAAWEAGCDDGLEQSALHQRRSA